MNTQYASRSSHSQQTRPVPRWGPWALVAVGVAALYVPTLAELFGGLWRTPEQGHGPIVLAVAAWLAFQRWPAAMRRGPVPKPIAGASILVVGLLLYVLGRSQDVVFLEVGSVAWVLLGVVLTLHGWHAVRVLWFPLFFLLFMIPLPGFIVDTLTMPMKIGVSWFVEHGLHAIGYPIARQGVVLHVGQYQLLVADVCAGLQTLFTLEAMGLLYLNLVHHASFFRNVALAVLIVPIAFIANAIRVTCLVLITYHFGDEVGQGFMHGFAGIVLFLSALGLIIAADGLLRLPAGAKASNPRGSHPRAQ
jgi:exosortase B